MRTLAVALSLLSGLLGCAGDDSATTAATMTSGAVTSAATTEDSATGSTPTASQTSEGTSEGTGESTGAGTESTTTTETTTEGTTSGLEICHLGTTGGSGGSTDPWLELDHHGTPVEDGVTLGLECGLQGLFMLELVPTFGGFEPDDEYVSIGMTVDVDGYNLNPDGHFYSVDELPFYIGCDVFDGGISYILAVIPPDTIDDLAELHGAEGQLSVTLYPDGGGAPVTLDRAFTINAEVDEMWEFCGYAP